MVTTDVELQLTQQLKEAGKRLLRPPTSDDELLHVLDQTDKLLSMVDQSPNDLMKEVLTPLQKCLVDRSLVDHSNVDVKVAVAACLSEITRVTAPEAPFDDQELKDVFRLIVSTFENLSDKSSRSYIKRASILETVCKVRSCVIMLDLECEELIVEMFEHFLKSIREHHPDTIFSSMVDIMSLIFEEIEEVSDNLLKPLLFSLKNDSEGVLPVARKLGEKILEKSRTILRPYLSKTLPDLGDSLDNYSPVLAAVCEGATVFEQNDESDLVQQQTDENKLAKERSEETPQADESKITVVSSEETTQVVKETSERPAETVATPTRILKIVMSNGGRVTLTEKDSSPVKESSKKPEEAIEHQDSSLASKADINDSVAELANVEFDKEGNKIDATLESVQPSDGENKDERENDIQVSVPELESKPEETSNKEVNKTDVTMTSSETSASYGESKDEKADEKKDEKADEKNDEKADEKKDDENKDGKNDENKDEKADENKEGKNDENKDEKADEKTDEKNDEIQVSVPEVETEVVNGPSQSGSLLEEMNVEKVEESEVANAGLESQSGGLQYKIHIRKGPRSKKKSMIKDDTPLIDVIKKKKAESIFQKDKLPVPATTATPEDEKKADTVASGAKSGKKVGGGSVKRKRKMSGKKSGGGKSGAKKAKKPLIEKDDESDSFDKPLRQSSAGKEDETDSDSKPIKLPAIAKKGNKNTSSSAKNKDGKKNASSGKKKLEEKDQAKSLPEDDDNDAIGMDISPKLAVKTATEEGKSEESSKRKRSVGKNNSQSNKNVKYDDSLIGLKVKVWWPDDHKYYEGVIESFDSAKNKHKVSYVDGDVETLNLKKEKWEILQEFSARNEKKPAEVHSTDDDETLSKIITYKSKGKSDSTKSKPKSKSKSKSTGVDEKELDDDDAAAEKSTEGEKSGSKKRKKM
ncbi:sister chromatid cohesion protein PDS5 homolog C [Lactuca sativa]|uniref:sister chromatid cohesion protein PDS5 homolog C n=1 Tax=Lactuca sativa TaxID=4236 RepID=UPI000CD7EBDE|nr:sister chromatid cohesion protein PDS5 homolog C [Lactuca sativa]